MARRPVACFSVLPALLLLPLLLPVPAACSTTGIIAGVVTTEEGEPLIGASVMVEGTGLGAITDSNGEYSIAGLPPGSYSVTARMVGRATSRAEGVMVEAGLMTRMDLSLGVDPSGHTEIIVMESRRNILQDVPSTVHVIDLTDPRTISAGGIVDVVADQPGVVSHGGELHVRGGRAGEVDYLLDGVSLRSPMDTGFDVELPLAAVSSASMMTGGLGVEYGNAMSGVVNLVGEEGGEELEGSLLLRHGSMTVSGTDRGEMAYMEESDEVSCRDGLTSVEGSVSGPEPLTRYILPALGLELPGTVRVSAAGRIGISGRDTTDTRGHWENGWRGDVSGMGKVTWRPVPRTSLSLGALGSHRESGWNEWAWSRYHRPAYLEVGPVLGRSQDLALPVRFGETTGLIANVTQLLGSETTLKLTLGGLRFQEWHRVRDPEGGWIGEDVNPVFWLTQYAPEDRLSDDEGFYHTGVHPNVWLDSKATVGTAMLDLDASPGTRLRYKLGGAFTYYDLYRLNVYALSRGQVYLSQWEAWPHAVAGYAQGSYRFPGGVIATAGVRADVFDANTTFFSGEEGAETEVEPKWQVSPRLGFSVPFSERSVFFATFGHYFQMPPLYSLFLQTSFNFAEERVVLGNPDLGPESTQLVEVGVRHYIDRLTEFSLSAYYKDITGLVSTEEHYEGTYYVFTNDDSHGMARGIELDLTRRAGSNISGSLSYSLSVAKGRYSSMLERYNYGQQGVVYFSSEENYLDWDQTHTLGADLRLSLLAGEGPSLAGLRPLERTTLGLSWDYGSGVPYTLPPQSGELVETNTERYPANMQTDLTLTRRQPVGPVELELMLGVYNLFGRRNVVEIYDSALFHATGDPTGQMGNPSAWSPARHFLLTLGVRW